MIWGLVFGRLSTVGASLTGLTYLSMAHTNVQYEQLARMTRFLPSLTDLDLQGCMDLRFYREDNVGIPSNWLAPLTAPTRLDLSRTNVKDKGMEALGPLTALTKLHLDFTPVSDQGLDLLAPLPAHLTHLILGGEGDNGDPVMIAVSSWTALTRLEMLYSGCEDFVSEEGLGALSSLTGIVHLELDSREVEASDES
jgi:hypothetical protein